MIGVSPIHGNNFALDRARIDGELAMPLQDQEPSDSQVRRAAKRVGLQRKSRRGYNLDNFGGYMLIEPRRNFVIAGERFDLIPNDALEFCGARSRG